MIIEFMFMIYINKWIITEKVGHEFVATTDNLSFEYVKASFIGLDNLICHPNLANR